MDRSAVEEVENDRTVFCRGFEKKAVDRESGPLRSSIDTDWTDPKATNQQEYHESQLCGW